jgi:LysM repeat protein
VKSGDTLYAIARRYDTTVDVLVRTNNLPAADSILNIGQKLQLP